ncbi:MAG: DUF362 domain-containing protein, partial [Candidatus Lokiarchaeota archaeon]|nr:DUF362 domain-containing protein [Candidatus Lokiarchaeota archaeon]
TLTTVTLSLKNQKGLLNLANKRKFHKKSLHEMITELGNVIRPDLVIMDAIYALEGSGPTENPQTNVRKPELLLAAKGQNAMVEIDNVAATMMGFDVNKIKHIPECDCEVKGIQLDEIDLNFAKPKETVDYGNIIHHQNEKACTLCQIAFSQTLRKIMFNQDIRKKIEEIKEKYGWIDILQGSGWEKLPENCKKAYLLGNCTKKFAEKINKNYCKGCPPHYNDIIDFLINNS